jgi:hypothetical protein
VGEAMKRLEGSVNETFAAEQKLISMLRREELLS